MESTFLSASLSFLVLLTIASFAYIFSKKLKFPFTVILVILWLLFIPISKIQWLEFINDFKLTPEVLFYIFLPILLFESSFNINYKELLKNSKSIFSLAIIWLLISSFIIAFALFFILPLVWFEIPFLVCLLFWAIISSTDPVAVLAIFKSMWAPRRLALIFEWESLFNDWTALALFLVVLWLITEWKWLNTTSVAMWIWNFSTMVVWWIIFWLFLWALFSKLIWKIKTSDTVEITLSLVMAHLTFILAEVLSEHWLKISWVIATVIASIVMWNYWRYKFSHTVWEFMERFWAFMAFIANSLVFILLWLILSDIDLKFSHLSIVIIITILIVMISRAISVYLPIFVINKLKLEKNIPLSRQHLLSWWSLRWALALMMVLMIPEDLSKFEQLVWWSFEFSVKDFVGLLVISSILFTLFIKATTISLLMKKLKIWSLNDREILEYEESKILYSAKVLEKIESLHDKFYLVDEEYAKLKSTYQELSDSSRNNIIKLLDKYDDKWTVILKKAISLHALWIEKRYLKELFSVNEINEKAFKMILWKINRQIDRIEEWNEQISSNSKNEFDFFEWLIFKFGTKVDKSIDKYIMYRTRMIICRKVIKELNDLKKIEFGYANSIFDEVIELYEKFKIVAEVKKETLFIRHKNDLIDLDLKLVNKSLLKIEENVVSELFEKEIITPKLFIKFREEIDSQIKQDYKKWTQDSDYDWLFAKHKKVKYLIK